VKRRVVLLYAIGPHFERALRVLRDRYADSELVALVPSNLPIDEQLANSVDRIEVMRKPDANAGSIRARIHYIRAVRNVRCDTLAVLYPSFAQQMVSALSRASEHLYIGPDGHFAVLTASPASLVASEFSRRIAGLLTFVKMGRAIWFTSIKPRAGRRDS
jgi:hypothetical protein